MTVCVCVCVRFTDGSENVSKVQTVLEARCLMSSNIRLTVSHSHAGKKDGEQMAQWYVYWEALDNRKGDGCCWNVTIIDQKNPKKKEEKKDHRHQHPYLETRTHARTHSHSYTNILHLHSNHSREREIVSMHRTRRYHKFYELISTWKNSQLTHRWGRFLF